MQKTKKISFLVVLMIIILMLCFKYVSTHAYSPAGNKIVNVNIKNKTFKAEIVSNDKKMEKGLANRRGICKDCGMLFKFSVVGKHSFWMKDMQFPLDIVWIKENKIVHLEKNIQPSFSGILNPAKDADAVLEINTGKADEFSFEIGDVVSF